jgi:Protein of unknown function (DUF3800)
VTDVLALDESGSTGVNLLDPDQPVFALASFMADEVIATDLLDNLPHPVTGELHFNETRGTPEGKANLLALLTALVRPDMRSRIKISVVHKQFMLVAKMVDLLLEAPLLAEGTSIYTDDLHLDMSHVLFRYGETAVGPGPWHQLLRTFQQAATKPAYSLARDLLDCLAAARSTCSRPTVRILLERMPKSLEELDEAGFLLPRGTQRRSSLDPAPTMLFQILNDWGVERGAGAAQFLVVHDEGSGGVQKWRWIFEQAIHQADEGTVELPSEHGVISLPLAASELAFADSRTLRQLQIADILASTTTYVMDPRGTKDPEFRAQIEELGFLELGGHLMWPEPK